MRRIAVVTLVLCGMLISCGMTRFILGPFGFLLDGAPVDRARDANGNEVLLDTPKTWAYFTSIFELMIADEKAKNFAPGHISWSEYWLMRIHYMEDKSWENGYKYIDYIVQRRRKSGLPELIEPEKEKLKIEK